jgi:anti-anti-sigma factor
MEIETRQENEAMVVTVTGRVDAVTSPELENSLSELVESDAKIIIVGLDALEYISSAGLRVILATAKKLKAKEGDVLLAGLHGDVKNVFDISGFTSIFRIFDTVEDALKQA